MSSKVTQELRIIASVIGLVCVAIGTFGTWASGTNNDLDSVTHLVRPFEVAFEGRYRPRAITEVESVTWRHVELIKISGIIGILGFGSLLLVLLKKKEQSALAILLGVTSLLIVWLTFWGGPTLEFEQEPMVGIGRLCFGAGGFIGVAILVSEIFRSPEPIAHKISHDKT